MLPPLPRAQVKSLIRELRSHKPCNVAKQNFYQDNLTGSICHSRRAFHAWSSETPGKPITLSQYEELQLIPVPGTWHALEKTSRYVCGSGIPFAKRIVYEEAFLTLTFCGAGQVSLGTQPMWVERDVLIEGVSTSFTSVHPMAPSSPSWLDQIPLLISSGQRAGSGSQTRSLGIFLVKEKHKASTVSKAGQILLIELKALGHI